VSATTAVNFLRGSPARANEPSVTSSRLLSKLGSAKWVREIGEGGSGVTFAEFVAIVNRALATFFFWHEPTPIGKRRNPVNVLGRISGGGPAVARRDIRAANRLV
jgi:hypothetical protein